MAKRDNGDGSVYRHVVTDPKTGDPVVRWRAALVVGTKRRYLSGHSEAEVRKKLRTLRSNLAQKRLATDPGDTASGWLRYWLDELAKPAVRATTWAGYSTAIQHWAIPHLGPRLKLENLTPEHLEQMYAKQRKAGLSPTTIRLTHRVMSRALKIAAQRNKVAENVALKVSLPPSEETEIDPLSLPEAQSVLRAAEGRRDEARWSVALALGLRQGEALGLMWDCVDLDAGTLAVRWQLQRASGEGLRLVPVKSRAGRRVVSLPPTLVAALRTHRSRQLQERLREGERWTGWKGQVPHGTGKVRQVDLVFPTRAGKPVSREEDWRAWKALLETAGVREVRLHDARHFAATLLLVQGVDPRVAMQIMGWSNSAMAARYMHVIPQLRDAVAAQVEAALWGGSAAGSKGGAR